MVKKILSICLFLIFLFLIMFSCSKNKDSISKKADLSSADFNIAKNHVNVEVTNKILNIVSPLIFGDNLSWRANGYNMWDQTTNSPKAEMLDKLKNSGITHLRYPGGIEGDYFHWKQAIGDNRIAQVDPFSHEYPTMDAVRGKKYVVDFGPDEFQKLIEKANIGATIILNAGDGTALEAKEWVEYCLKKGVNVESFCVGNEVNFKLEAVDGMHITKNAREYIDFYNDCYNKLGTLVDKIKLGCIGLPNSHPLNYQKNWDKEVLSALSDKIDFIDVHIGYSPYFSSGNSKQNVVKSFLASSKWVKQKLEEVKSTMRSSTGKNYTDIDIQITEYGPICDQGYENSLAGSLFLADFFNVILEEPKVKSANHLPMINHYTSGNIIGALIDPTVNIEEEYWDNCVTYVFRMYVEMINRQMLETNIVSDKFSSLSVGLVPKIEDVNLGTVTFFFDDNKKEGSIFIINKDYTNNTIFDIIMPFKNCLVTKITELWDKNPASKNSWNAKEIVKLKEYDSEKLGLLENTFSITTKPISLVKIDFKSL